MKKKLAKFKEKIYTCSKCGLCQSVCPIFDITKDDTLCARGKYILLNGLLQDEIEQSQELVTSLNFCLKCNKCKDFCPSNLDTKEVLDAILEPSGKLKCKITFPRGSKITFPTNISGKVVFHKPCHFNKMDEFSKWIKQNEQIDLISIEKKCCGWGNNLDKTHPQVAKKISKKLIKKLISKNPSYIITACPNCKSAIEQGLSQAKISEIPKVILLEATND